MPKPFTLRYQQGVRTRQRSVRCSGRLTSMAGLRVMSRTTAAEGRVDPLHRFLIVEQGEDHLFSIHPRVGVARIGNSRQEFYLAPEEIGGLPTYCDANGNES